MKKFLILLFVALSVATFGQSIDRDLANLGRQIVGQAVDQQIGRQAAKEQQRSIDRLIESTNQEFNKKLKNFRLPEDLRVALEIDLNNTSVPNPQFLGIAKASLEDWWDGLVPSANFENRNQVQEINGRDRNNPELRNPIPPARMTNRSIDVHLTAIERQGLNSLNIDTDIVQQIFRHSFLGISGDYNDLRQIQFVELTVEFRDAATQESLRTIHVIGCDVQGYSVSVDAQSRRFNVFYRKSQQDNLPNAFSDAFRRAQAIAEGRTAKH